MQETTSEVTCESLVAEGGVIVEKPSCALASAFFSYQDIMAGTDQQVTDVCTASPSCVEELMPVVDKAVELQCEDAEFVLQLVKDIDALTKYFCTGDGNCYEETKAFIAGEIDSVECECLLAFKESAAEISDETKVNLGITDVILEGTDQYIKLKECFGGEGDAPAAPGVEGEDATSSASTQKMHAAAAALFGAAVIM